MTVKPAPESGLSFVLHRLRETMQAADKDGGLTYDTLAERIRQHASDGLVQEALGYVPEEAENVEACDPFRPLVRIERKGREGKRYPYKKGD